MAVENGVSRRVETFWNIIELLEIMLQYLLCW